MSMNQNKKLTAVEEISKKRDYIKPMIQSEKLNSYGAVCNGTTVGGRKASTTAPAFCNASKRNS